MLFSTAPRTSGLNLILMCWNFLIASFHDFRFLSATNTLWEQCLCIRNWLTTFFYLVWQRGVSTWKRFWQRYVLTWIIERNQVFTARNYCLQKKGGVNFFFLTCNTWMEVLFLHVYNKLLHHLLKRLFLFTVLPL